jgi:hypothetical protein
MLKPHAEAMLSGMLSGMLAAMLAAAERANFRSEACLLAGKHQAKTVLFSVG